MNTLTADFLREQDDIKAHEDDEREKLLKHLSIDFFLDAITESENSDLVQMVDAFKEGDTLRLGNLVRDRINEYMEQTLNPEPAPYCHACGARQKIHCHCGPLPDNF